MVGKDGASENASLEGVSALPDGLSGIRAAIIGIGYVGLPVAAALGQKVPTIAFDTNEKRVADLKAGHDDTLEVSTEELAAAKHLTFTSDPDRLKDANFYIVSVPTPIDTFKRPDVTSLVRASETIGRSLKPGDVVVYESTVYPGATEEDCVPVLEQVSGLAFNKDFFVGYSPERINPGDKVHRLADIVKVTSGSTPEAADLINTVYASIVTAGTHQASSIRVAEAAKVIENIQRDVNIALVNELAVLFQKLDLNTEEVLEASGTKWNFLPFRPGLVGGHCIGVDPYYLTHKAQQVGFHPEIIAAGRRINDGMGDHSGQLIVDALLKKGRPVHGGRVLVLGVTFKEDCPDLRNTLVSRVLDYLTSRGVEVEIHDPWVDPDEARREFGMDIVEEPEIGGYDGVVIAVSHREFRDMGAERIRSFLKPDGALVDLKWLLTPEQVDGRL